MAKETKKCDDEFEDADFLTNFDLDAVILSQSSSSSSVASPSHFIRKENPYRYATPMYSTPSKGILVNPHNLDNTPNAEKLKSYDNDPVTTMNGSQSEHSGSPSKHPPSSGQVMAKETKRSDDEFGDADFLTDFDVEAVVLSQLSSSSSVASPSRFIRNADPCSYATPLSYSNLPEGTSVNPHNLSNTLSPNAEKFKSYNNNPVTTMNGSQSEHSSSLRKRPRLFVQPPSKELNKQNKSGCLSQLSPTTLAVTSPTKASSFINSTQQQQDIHPKLKRDLTQTLHKYFDHTAFRPGQLTVISALVSKPNRDVAVFWSTGSGKSLCYQIPPLHLNKIALVISPMSSLMEEQVAKLNGLLSHIDAMSSHVIATNITKTSRNDMAVFLGTGQRDLNAEARALRGEYKIIYCTPEKLLGGNFLNALGTLHTTDGNHSTNLDDGRICLIAVNESHCVSEWGHDFRPRYRSIGPTLRIHPILKSIPFLTLTSTAVPRVQADIIKCLRLQSNVKIVKQSFDRENLIISILRKPFNGGFRFALKPLVNELIVASQKKAGRDTIGATKMLSGQSTIIYCSKKDTVNDVSLWLANELKASSVRVQSYHAGLSMRERTETHTNFLIGRTTAIVATDAFGMGVDKPDTRRVIHYGPPKTVEEYYQQIGRAGRDGLPAFCIMYCDDEDFRQYKSDSYIGNLKTEVKATTIHSIDALRDFSMSSEICRRAALLLFFDEIPSFGDRCGTCDNCVERRKNAEDLERDFGDMGARAVLVALEALNGRQDITVIKQVLKGDLVENYRYRSCKDVEPMTVRTRILALKERMGGKKRPDSYLIELLPLLVDRGFVKESTECDTMPGSSISRSYATYDLTKLGSSVLELGRIVLPVTALFREFEATDKEKLQQTFSTSKSARNETERIPEEGLEAGEREVTRTFKTWRLYLDALRKAGRTERIDRLNDLRYRIEAWRSDISAYYKMTPASVMDEPLMVKIAHSAASIQSGSTLGKEALLAVGVRSEGIDSLVTVIADWIEETQQKTSQDDLVACAATCLSAPMVFAPNEHFSPAGPWKYSVYKQAKKTGMASWESSYNRFFAGEQLQAIAMSPVNGRPIQVFTVVGHILEGLLQGRPIPMLRLATAQKPPTKAEWERLMQCEVETGIDVTKDPNTSGPGGDRFSMTAFLTPIMGNLFAGRQYFERTEVEHQTFAKWCKLLKWYLTLRRVGYTPTFANDQNHGVIVFDYSHV